MLAQSKISTGNFGRPLLLAAAFLMAGAVPLAAQTESSWEICQRSHLAADQVVTACNDVITARGAGGDLGIAYWSRGNAFARRGEPDQAINDFDEALSRKPGTADIFFSRGKAWHAKSDLWRAINDFDRAIMRNASDARYFQARARAWIDRNDLAQAHSDFDEAIRLDPKNPASYAGRAEMHAKKGEADLAIADYDEAIRLSPKDAQLVGERAALSRKHGERTRIAFDHSAAPAPEPKRVAPAQPAPQPPVPVKVPETPRIEPAAREAFAKETNKEADKDWLACRAPNTAIGPRVAACTILIEGKKVTGHALAETYSNRGAAYIQKKDYDRAIKDLDEAIRIEPEVGFFYGNRAIAHFFKDDRQRAAADFDEQIRLAPNAARSYTYRAIMHEKLGRRAQAIADYNKAISLEPNRPDALDGLKRLGVAAPKGRPEQAERHAGAKS